MREVTQDRRFGMRFQAGALQAFQEAAEQYLSEVFADSQELAVHTKLFGGRLSALAARAGAAVPCGARCDWAARV